MIGDFDRLYRHMEHYYNNCSADEEIGFRQALKYLKYVIKREHKQDQFNIRLENKLLRKEQNRLMLKINDLEEDNLVLSQRIERMNRVKQH